MSGKITMGRTELIKKTGIENYAERIRCRTVGGRLLFRSGINRRTGEHFREKRRKRAKNGIKWRRTGENRQNRRLT